ncbi:hypothetical protein ACP70R_004940 [Stipagrostis hirtigluma subsp. patula]
MASSSSSSAADPPVHVAFNSDATHFVAATASGIRVFSCSPFEHVLSRSGFASPDGEVASADVVLPGPLVAAVSGNTIKYWSELHGEMAIHPMGHGVVRAVRHVGDHVAVAGDDRAALLGISRDGVRPVVEVDTGPNPLGACALVQVDGGQPEVVLACPSPPIGWVQIWRGGRRVVVDRCAHYTGISCLALSRDGRLLATAGIMDKRLLIFRTTDCRIRQQIMWLAVSSDMATIDIFQISSRSMDGGDLEATQASSDAANANVASSKLSRLFDYTVAVVTAQYSVASFRLDEGIRYMVAFGQEPNIILVIGIDGSFRRYQFDPMKPRDVIQIEHKNITKMN